MEPRETRSTLRSGPLQRCVSRCRLGAHEIAYGLLDDAFAQPSGYICCTQAAPVSMLETAHERLSKLSSRHLSRKAGAQGIVQPGRNGRCKELCPVQVRLDFPARLGVIPGRASSDLGPSAPQHSPPWAQEGSPRLSQPHGWIPPKE